MIFAYGLWKKIEKQLQKDYPQHSIRNIQKHNKVQQMLAKQSISKRDLLVFLRFSEGDRKLQRHLMEQGYSLYPNALFSDFIQNRKVYLSEIDKWTKYPLKRVYVQEEQHSMIDLIDTHFGSLPVVLKVGNLHASEGKWLINEDRFFPRMSHKMRKMDKTIEEFVPNARSIRVGIVGDARDSENYYLTEHVNSKTWLKNNAPEEENTYSYQERYLLGIPHIDDIINETKEVAIRYKANLIGVDWVINEEKTGLLEVNDMIGLPDGEFAFQLFYKELKRIYEEYL